MKVWYRVVSFQGAQNSWKPKFDQVCVICFGYVVFGVIILLIGLLDFYFFFLFVCLCVFVFFFADQEGWCGKHERCQNNDNSSVPPLEREALLVVCTLCCEQVDNPNVW